MGSLMGGGAERGAARRIGDERIDGVREPREIAERDEHAGLAV